MKSSRVKNLTRITLSAVILCISTWLCIPFVIPFTMQTFAVFFVLSLLGGKKGSLAIAVYLLLGIVGLPVFSGFRSGIGTILGPTGGYLVGFLATGLISMLGEVILHRPAGGIFTLIVGLFVCYAFGTVWFCHIAGGQTFLGALMLCVLPYVIPDLCKLFFAVFVAGRLRPTIK